MPVIHQSTLPLSLKSKPSFSQNPSFPTSPKSSKVVKTEEKASIDDFYEDDYGLD